MHDDPLLERRGFLQLGGATIAMAALFAATACGNDGNDATGGGEGDEEAALGDERDVTILRTSASVALAAVDFYQRAIDGGLLTTATADAAKEFQAHHREHADLFNGAAKAADGEAVTQPNTVVAQALQSPLAQAKDEPAVLAFALQVENTTLATYLASVGRFKDAGLNRATMSAGGVAARHAAVLAGLLHQPPAAKAAFTADGAIAPGTGL